MITELIRELLTSFIGRISLVAFVVLGGTALYVVLAFSGDFGKNAWNDPGYWANNPKSAPPFWITWFGKDRAEHHLFESFDPQVEEAGRGKNYLYEFGVRINPESPPTFMSLVLSNISYEHTPPIIEVSLEGQDSAIFLYRHIVSGARDGEAAPIIRYKGLPYRTNLTADPEAKRKLISFLDELWAKGKKDYRVRVLARLSDQQDDMQGVKVVLGGDAYGWLGTDNIGRDVFTGILAGLPWALLVGLPSAFIATWIGMVMGGVGGYFGGKRDTTIQLLMDVISLLPILPLLIYLSYTFSPHLMFVVAILSLTGWIGLARKLRPAILQIRESGFITYFRSLGFSSSRIIFGHILPQTLPFTFMYCAFFVSGAILTEAGLSILGLGDPSIATWGQMLEQGITTGAVFLGYWWWILPPGIAIVLTSLSLFLFFRSLEKAAEPRLRSSTRKGSADRRGKNNGKS